MRLFVIAIVVIVLLLSLFACASPTNSTPDASTRATQVDDASPFVPTYTPCPPVTPVVIATPVRSGRLIYILIDRSSSYREFTGEALSIVQEVLSEPDNLRPGDKIYIGWVSADVEVVLQEEIDTIPFPSLTPPVPTPSYCSSTVTPSCLLPPTLVGQSRLQQIAATQTASAILIQCTVVASQVEATATAEADAFAMRQGEIFCRQREANEHNIRAYDDWRRQQEEEVSNAAERLEGAMSSIEVRVSSETHLYEALYVASRVMGRERNSNAFVSYNLVILSDMEDVGSVSPTDLDFTDVRTFMGLVNCSNMQQCYQKEQLWRSRFLEWGSSEIQFATRPEMSSELLRIFLDHTER